MQDQIFTRAYELLSEFGIARGDYAQNDDGEGVSTFSPDATSYCSVGAISRAAFEVNGSNGIDTAIAKLQMLTGGLPVTHWNDHVAGDKQILATFRKAAGIKETAPAEPIAPEEIATEELAVA